eukprot:scaffold143992_cov166-Phaeocystis_antarctica.AAC.1
MWRKHGCGAVTAPPACAAPGGRCSTMWSGETPAWPPRAGCTRSYWMCSLGRPQSTMKPSSLSA